MALINSFTAAELNDKLGFEIEDTGNWSVSGNPAKTAILSDSIAIAIPGSDFMPSSTIITVDVLALGFPVITPTEVSWIDDMLQTGTMPDGAYEITRTTEVDGSGTYVYTYTAIFRRVAVCCRDSYVAGFAPCDCDEGKEKILKLARWNTDLDAVVLAESCQDVDAGVTALQDATDICNQQGCGSCNC